MSRIVSAASLHHRARTVNAVRAAAWLATAAISALGTAAWTVRVGWSPWLAIVPAIVITAIGVHLIRSRPVTAQTIANHIDRTVGNAEESTSLLLDPADSVIARLQRRRVVDALADASLPPIPSPTLRAAFLTATSFSVAFAIALVLPVATAESSDARGAVAVGTNQVPVAITATTLQWTPPRYTARPTRTAATRNITVEDGSVVRWSVDAPGAESVQIITSAGDTITAHRGGDAWTVTSRIDRPILWRVEAQRDSDVVRGPDRLVSVVADHPPLISVITPPSRMSLDWREPHQAVVRALVSDDYALGATRLIALVGGRGEGTKFRERSYDVEIEARRRPASIVVTRRIDLDSLGIQPGDEVLLTFEAFDRREPRAQSARSETVFISILDTLGVGQATLPGIALTIEPAYFRSQRQIILDTEALLRDIRLGQGGDVMRRSMDIGYEQHLLRVRYGALVGDETEGGPDAHAGEDDRVITADDFRHNHDMAENATLLSASVKSLLKGALAAMWDAEKQLRTGNPRAALPSEYLALESLEAIRRASRAYVKRIGFEPPAIDVSATRLTKRATGLSSLTGSRTESPDDPDLPVRQLILALNKPGAVDRDALEAAATRLAERAVNEVPGSLLETLGVLRRVLDGCNSCRPALRRSLLAALPNPAPPLLRRPVGGAQ